MDVTKIISLSKLEYFHKKLKLETIEPSVVFALIETIMTILMYWEGAPEEIDNPEFEMLITDAEGKILLGKRKDGTWIFMGQSYKL